MAAFDIRLDFGNEQLDALQAKLEEAVRPAAQAGAQVLYDEARLRVPVSLKAHGYKGNPGIYKPGNLKAAIYQVYSKDNSSDTKATYQISFNKDKAFYGRFVEFGTAKLAAKPFLRPSYDAKKQTALEASKARFIEIVNAGASNVA